MRRHGHGPAVRVRLEAVLRQGLAVGLDFRAGIDADPAMAGHVVEPEVVHVAAGFPVPPAVNALAEQERPVQIGAKAIAQDQERPRARPHWRSAAGGPSTSHSLSPRVLSLAIVSPGAWAAAASGPLRCNCPARLPFPISPAVSKQMADIHAKCTGNRKYDHGVSPISLTVRRDDCRDAAGP